MSNIYEALEQAVREKSAKGEPPKYPLQTQVNRAVALADEMAWLHHQIDFLLAGNGNKVLQFMGTRRGEGVSTVVREFAKTAVEKHGKSVLVLDSAYQDPSRRINFNITCDYGWTDLLDKGELVDKAFFRFGESSLYFAPVSVQASLAPPNDISANVTLWNKLKERFDLILIDSSSDLNTTESIALTRNVDGVVLVIEAGKSRKRVVQSIKKKILANGGNILGVVLNKRRFFIPDSIYKRL